MNRRASGTALALAFLTACSNSTPVPLPEPTAPKTPQEVRRALTDAMIREDHCYRGSLDYAIRDPDFLDQVLSSLLGNSTLQELTTDPKEFAALVQEAPSFYTKLMYTEDGLARLSRIIGERFAKPVISETGDTVRADYGHIAARLGIGRGNRIGIQFSNSPHIDENWEWKTPEVAAALQSLIDKYPNAACVELRVLIPGGLSPDEWLYVYRKKVDIIRVVFPAPPRREYYTDPIRHDLGPFIRGEASLDTKLMHQAGYR